MVIIGLGSNMGERAVLLDAALIKLGRIIQGMVASSRIETPALLMPGSPKEWDVPFLNMAVSGTTDLGPQELLTALKHIEQEMGRIDRGRWAPREIDLDVLVYDDMEIREVNLVVPHPELFNRYFALAPLAEIAPNWFYKGKTAKAWLEEKFP